MPNLQSSLNNKQDQLIQRFERDKLDRLDTSKYAALEQHIDKIVLLPTADLLIEDNCRKTLDKESTQFFQLMSSIKKEGILQNLVVEIHKSPKIRLICTSGQRRLLIARMLEIEKVPCLIKLPIKNSDSLARSLDENILREDLVPFDLAESYLSLANDGWELEKISERYERDKRTIQYYINLAKFPLEAKNIIKANSSFFTSRILLNEFAKKKWPSDEVLISALKERTKDKNSSNTKKMDESFVSLAKKLTDQTGLKVKLQKNKNNVGGKVTFSFKDDLELSKLLKQIS